MPKKTNLTEIKRLEAQILLHKKKYYEGEPIISDAQYDALEDKLRELNPESPVLFIVGSPESSKITHEFPMLSCQKASDVEEILEWSKGLDLYVGYKIDGFSLSLIYENGKLIQAATRGNGVNGDDSTIVAMKIASIPKKIPETARITVRGELFMRISEFNRINESEGGKYNSPRNLAVGTIKQKDLKLFDKRSLDFKTFELIGYQNESSLESKTELMKSWGFNTADFVLLKSPSNREIKNVFERVENQRRNLDFEIDGLIFKYNDAIERELAGETAHHPRWIMALKFTSQGKKSSIKGITWQVGRMGVLTPVAELEPVEVMGAVIKRATLHNTEFLETLDVSIGDRVMVIRSGDVIPKITGVVSKGPNKAKLPKTCPSCGSAVEREGVNLICSGKTCREKEIQRIRHWVKILDIIGLGPKNIAKLYDSGLVRHFSDLYDSKLTEGKLLSLLGKNGLKIHKNIQTSREIPYHIFLAALGIESLGKQIAKVLAREFSSYDELKNSTISRLVSIEGISDVTAKYILNGINDPFLGDRVIEKGIKILYKGKKGKIAKKKVGTLVDFISGPDKPEFAGEQEKKTKSVKNKTVYVTGKVEGLSKKQVQKDIEEMGFEWASVSKRLDFLVKGEKPGKKKIEKAKNFGVTILTWDEFRKQVSKL
ncbi:MAG: NAD-dependent DNA ligase LigA [Candidatus Hodarchaeales archaeon]